MLFGTRVPFAQLLIFSVISAAVCLPLRADEAPGTATGKKIGNAVAAAVSTAFPAVDTILKALFPAGQKPKDKSKTDVESAVNTERGDAEKRAIAALSPLITASSDLQVVSVFLEHAVTANESLLKLGVRVSSNSVSADDWKLIRDDWSAAKDHITILKTVPGLEHVGDIYLRDKLKAISDVNFGMVSNIASHINDKDLNLLRTDLATLQPVFQGVTLLAGYLISDLTAGLKTIPDKLKGGQGIEGTGATEVFAQKLNRLYPTTDR